MINKIIVFFVLLTSYTNHLHAQVEVGQHIDLDGYLIDGFFDPIAYHPETLISSIYQSSSYEKGYYYDLNDKRINGSIFFENNKIFFRSENENRKRVKPTEAKSIVLGVDSFFAISNFYFKNRLKKHPEFVQYVTEINGYTFVKHHHFTTEIEQQYSMRDPIISTYLVKYKDESIWYNFHNNSSLKEKALKYFGHIPILRAKINSKYFIKEDMEDIIKMAEFYNKYQKSLPIYLDKYWLETKDDNRKVYTVNVTEIVDSVWTLEYSKADTLLYSIQYTSFSPFNKDGKFYAFYPDGKVRQKTIYKSNKPKDVKTFNTNGELTKHYQYKKHSIPHAYSPQKKTYYHTVNQLLKEDTNRIKLNQKYQNNTLVESFFTIESDTVYQITDPNYNLNIRSLKKRFGYYINSDSYKNAIHENAQGTILASFIMDPKGYIIGAKLLNTLHPEIDSLLHDFFSNEVLKESRQSLHLKPYKINKTKQYCEFVVPFQFGINRFYRETFIYYNDYNNMMFQYQLHQQAIMSQYQLQQQAIYE